MVIGISANLLGAVFQSQLVTRTAASLPAPPTGASASARSGGSSGEATPPWEVARDSADIRRSVLASGEFFNLDSSEFSRLDASDDEKALFAMYQGLRRLRVLADAAASDTTRAVDLRLINRRFEEGVAQLDSFFSGLSLDGVTVLRGEELEEAETGLSISRGASNYETGLVYRGDPAAGVIAFAGAAEFTINVRKSGVETPLTIDLSSLADADRTMENVATLINDVFSANAMATRFEIFKIGEEDENGIIPGNDYGFRIKGISTEVLSFSAPAPQPAAYLIGATGEGDTVSGQLNKIVDFAGGGSVAVTAGVAADPDITTRTDLLDRTVTEETPNPLEARDVLVASDGGVYVLGQTRDTVDGRVIKGEADLVLKRFDSAGGLVWTRTLGAGESADGLSLAEAPDGGIIVAGSVTGALANADSIGGTDSFVARFETDGRESWLQRFGGRSDDQANAVSVGADGTIYVAGETGAAFGGATFGAGQGAYVRAYDPGGALIYTRAVGAAAGSEAAVSLAQAADGGLLVASEEDGAAVLRKFAAGDDGTGAPVWTLDLGSLDGGALGGLAVDDAGAIYLAGSAGPAFDAGANNGIAAANQGGRDGFVLKIADGASADVLDQTFIGSTTVDAVTGVAVSGERVYLSGFTAGDLPGETLGGTRDAFAATLDRTGLAFESAVQIDGRDDIASGAAIAVDPQGDSVLDAFGLPRGELVFSDSRIITERSSARDGDFFYVSVDGGRKRKITLEADDTFRSLTFKLNAVFVLDAVAEVRRGLGGETLRITPRDGVSITLSPGDDGEDALGALGLKPGEYKGDPPEGASSTADAPSVFELKLPDRFSIATPEDATALSALLGDALAEVQRAYRDLTLDPALKALLNADDDRPGIRGGTPPAFLMARIANYEAGLQRLLAGSPSSTGALF